MAILQVDLSQLPPSARATFDRVCREQTAAEIVQAKIRQKQLAKHFRDNPPRAQEAIGGQTMVLDPFIWAALRRVTNAAPGEDEEVQNWAARKYPEWCRVRHLPTRLQVGYGSSGLPASPPRPGVRFRKVYPNHPQPTTDH
jgi:hypothetical protein